MSRRESDEDKAPEEKEVEDMAKDDRRPGGGSGPKSPKPASGPYKGSGSKGTQGGQTGKGQ